MFCFSINIFKSKQIKSDQIKEPRPSMAANWAAMSGALGGSEPRACILCGVPCSGKSYHAGIFAEDVEKAAQTSQLQAACLNMCVASISYADEREEPIATVVMCPSCNHWTQRRSKMDKFITPLTLLHHYINTTETVDGKAFDSRVLHRLAKTISDPGNYYRVMFSVEELELITEIATSTITLAHAKVARFYANKHGLLFCTSRKVSEFLRHHLVNCEDLQPEC